MTLFFLFLASIILLSSIMILITRVPIYAMLYLVLCFVNTGVLLLLLGLDFFAYIYVIIYVGAIAILFLFAIMMVNTPDTRVQRFFTTKKIDDEEYWGFDIFYLLRVFFLVFLSYYLVYYIFYSDNFLLSYLLLAQYKKISGFYFLSGNPLLMLHTINFIALYFYTAYFPLFILSGVILFIGMVGAIVIAINRQNNIKRQLSYEQLQRITDNSIILHSKK